jgi:DNA-binding PadR family transcriptional regulator
MSSTRLLILGVVWIFQPVHGYDVRRELLSWHADEWANVAPGSIYHALKKLAEEGLLREVGQEQVGGRPNRTPYEITPKGAEEFYDLLRRTWWEYETPIDPFTAAWVFIFALPKAEAVAALRNRARVLRLYGDGVESRLGTEVDDGNAPHVPYMMRLGVLKARAEAGWCDEMADLIDAGGLDGFRGEKGSRYNAQ